MFSFISIISFAVFICISNRKSNYDDDTYFDAISQNCKYVHQIQIEKYLEYSRVKHHYHKEMGIQFTYIYK